MGYDPYDYYDLGQFDQKGNIKTWFGSKQELLDLIETIHFHGLTVLADMVFNHNSGADATEVNPSLVRAAGHFFNPEVASSLGIGSVSTPPLTRAGTTRPLERCQTSATAIPTSLMKY
jgi:hypothetical protein